VLPVAPGHVEADETRPSASSSAASPSAKNVRGAVGQLSPRLGQGQSGAIVRFETIAFLSFASDPADGPSKQSPFENFSALPQRLAEGARSLRPFAKIAKPSRSGSDMSKSGKRFSFNYFYFQFRPFVP